MRRFRVCWMAILLTVACWAVGCVEDGDDQCQSDDECASNQACLELGGVRGCRTRCTGTPTVCQGARVCASGVAGDGESYCVDPIVAPPSDAGGTDADATTDAADARDADDGGDPDTGPDVGDATSDGGGGDGDGVEDTGDAVTADGDAGGDADDGSCTENADCADGEVCSVDGQCVPECAEHADCADDQYCNSNSYCEVGCRSDADCPDGEYCDGERTCVQGERTYRFLQIRDISSGSEACGVADPGSDIVSVELRGGSVGTLQGWGEAINSELLGQSNAYTNVQTVLDGDRGAGDTDGCPDQFSDDTVVALGCSGLTAVGFPPAEPTGGADYVEIQDGDEVTVNEYGAQCGGSTADSYRVSLCEYASASELAAESSVAPDGDWPRCGDEVLGTGTGTTTFDVNLN